MNLQLLFYTLYTEINLFGAVIMLVLFCRLVLSNRIPGQSSFRRILLWQTALFVSDALARIAMDCPDTARNLLVMLFDSVYFTSSVGMTCEYFIYFACSRNTRMRQDQKLQRRIRIPLDAYIVLIVLNFPLGFLFYMDAAGTYHRGPVFFLTHIICSGYAIVSTVSAFRDAFRMENYAERKDYLTYVLFPILPFAAALFQYFVTNIPVMCPVLSILSIVIFINAMEQLIFTDPLTGLANRRSFVNTLVTRMESLKKDENLYFIMFDLNDFKTINDQYGHRDGDAALTIMADALQQAAGENQQGISIGRYGGDEFAAALTAGSLETVENYLEAVRQGISRLSEERNLQGQISFSAGVARWNGSDDPGRLIASADQEMYHMKAEFKQFRR
ncbi:MAG: diguanylate cyclase domain-containing protein [Lachnospiraceae bacterium]